MGHVNPIKVNTKTDLLLHMLTSCRGSDYKGRMGRGLLIHILAAQITVHIGNFIPGDVYYLLKRISFYEIYFIRNS